MKKEYSKPDILFDSFSLSNSIAGNCEVKTNLPSNDTCGVNLPGVGPVFTTQMGGCGIKVIDGRNNYNNLCYYVPHESNNVFNS